MPEFNLNEPFRLNTDTTGMTEKEKQDACNQMWRNLTINDTYEPGSTFKIITMAAGLSQGVVHPDDQFSCPGFKVVEDRRIHCHKRTGHGAENFVQGAMNSCNPVFIEVGLRLGVDNYYRYFQQFGLMKKTGIDLPGEAATIMHKKENIGEVELATISFGQSFQITPIQLATTVSSIINGGRRITPHFGVKVTDEEGNLVKELKYKEEPGIVSKEVSKEVCQILGQKYGRENSNVPDTSEKRQPLYFLFSGIYTCGKSKGSGNLRYSQPSGDLLRRHDCSSRNQRNFREYSALHGD